VDSGGQEWPDDTSAELTVSPESLPRISGPVYLELQINKISLPVSRTTLLIHSTFSLAADGNSGPPVFVLSALDNS
jgi:hypothetical protein